MNNESFYALTPERVLESLEKIGWVCTGRCQALNSFENRVYDVELDLESMGLEHDPKKPWLSHRVVKFYRPGRWTREQILEEHSFLLDLKNAEIPVVFPLDLEPGVTLKIHPDIGIYYAVFPRVGGRAPDELDHDQLMRIGRLLARIHQVGSEKPAPHRTLINPQTYGKEPLEYLMAHGSHFGGIPLEFERKYRDLVEKIIKAVTPLFDGLLTHRLHGDCHLGNLLWNAEGPFFLDFDDMVIGPAVQDFWLLIPSRDQEGQAKLESMLEGYESLRRFDRKQLRLIEPLRALRFVHYTAWVAKRWSDPAFPLAFPQFGSHRYWQDETQDLERQWSLIEGKTKGLE